MAVLCGGEVRLASDSWGEEGQSFPARLVLTNLTTATTFSLVPLWDRLTITPSKMLISPGETEVSLNMTADQFYLYQLNISCSTNLTQHTANSAIFEVPVRGDIN